MDPEKRSWFEAQLDTYHRAKPAYDALSSTLATMLDNICRKVAPGAKTDGRGKTEFSFAEKILRKEDKYGREPFAHIRDLGGARAIVYTLDQVRSVCGAIEKADGKGLRIDWKNSVDLRGQLGTDRFGYTGIHYIVELTGEPLFGVKPPFTVCATTKSHLFAEIQVCTFLQHVWAAIYHDRVYKTELVPPKTLKRDLSAVSALLESADNAFARTIHDLDVFEDEFDSKLSARKLEDQIDKWTEIVVQCPASHTAAYELGRRLLAAERWDDAYRVLETIKDSAGGVGEDQREHDHRVKLDRARAALRTNQRAVGRSLLAQIVAADSGNYIALTLLGTDYLQEGDLNQAGRWLNEAFNLKPDEPKVLAPYLELLLRRPGNLFPRDLHILQGTLKAAIDRCRECEERQVRLPEALFARGRFCLMLGDAYQSTSKSNGDQPDNVYAALDAYCLAIVASRTCVPIADELDVLERIIKDRCMQGSESDNSDQHGRLCADARWEGPELARMLLRLALVAKSWQCLNENIGRAEDAERAAKLAEDPAKKATSEQIAALRNESAERRRVIDRSRSELERFRAGLAPFRTQSEDGRFPDPADWPAPIVVVAGGCDEKFGPGLVANYGQIFNAAFSKFRGTIIGGGTTAGVSGMVANLQTRYAPLAKIGYLPPREDMPIGDEPAEAYAIRRTFGSFKNPNKTDKREYSKAGPLQMWADLLAQPKIDPSHIRLLGIDGGKISGFEFRLAVAMGASVGVVVDSQRAVKTLLEDKGWKQPEGVVPLPTDAATWAAFVRSASPELKVLDDDAIDTAAEFVHEEYRQSWSTQANAKKHHESVLPWKAGLPQPYKESNRNQVRYAKLILQDSDYETQHVDKADSANPSFPDGYMDKKTIEKMAELEHGRFCAERLADGWRYGPKNDFKEKINDTLIPWNDPRLLDSIKEYDRIAVRNYPKWLARANLIIVPKPTSQNNKSP
jgi:ppGpp synthetase/RelA/SpoT-type nucleotidyltranferase